MELLPDRQHEQLGVGLDRSGCPHPSLPKRAMSTVGIGRIARSERELQVRQRIPILVRHAGFSDHGSFGALVLRKLIGVMHPTRSNEDWMTTNLVQELLWQVRFQLSHCRISGAAACLLTGRAPDAPSRCDGITNLGMLALSRRDVVNIRF